MGATVDVAPTYQTVLPKSKSDALAKRLQSENIDVLTFTSSSTVKNFLTLTGESLLPKIKKIRIACIGPVTAKTAEELLCRLCGDGTNTGNADFLYFW